MERASKTVKSMFVAMTQRGERSKLFWWFVENHDDIVEGAKRQRIQWAVVIERANELGLTNRSGAPPTRKLAKLTWQRAQIYVAATSRADAAAMARPLSPFPMPRSSDVRPVTAEPPVLSSTVPESGGPVMVTALAERSLSIRGVAEMRAPPQVEARPSFAEAAPAPSICPAPLEPPSSLAPLTEQLVWTPEQIAHRDAVMAKARAKLDYVDRFLNL